MVAATTCNKLYLLRLACFAQGTAQIQGKCCMASMYLVERSKENGKKPHNHFITIRKAHNHANTKLRIHHMKVQLQQ